MLIDWCCSLVLVFLLHYIAIFIIYCNDAIVAALKSGIKDLNAETLQGQIVSLYANPVVYEQTHEHALQMGKPNAAYDIIDLLKNICKKGN